MSETITGSSSDFSTTATVPTDGDARTAASVKTPFQRLLDNDTYLQDQLVTQGAKKLRRVADTTALKAINTTSGVADGEVRVVGDGTSFKGLYVYESGSSATESLPWIVQPTTGSGRWYHASLDLRVPAFGPVDHAHIASVTSDTTSSGSYVDITHPAITFEAAAGDIVEIWVKVLINPGAANKGYARVRWIKPDTSSEVLGESFAGTNVANVDNFLMLMACRDISDAGNYDVRIQHNSNDGSTTVTTEILSVIVNVRRP